jgi:hypothetical protein
MARKKNPPAPTAPPTPPAASVLAAVQSLVRVIHETLNARDPEGDMGPGHGRFVRPIRAADALMISLGSLLEGPGLDRINLASIERPGPLDRLAVALRDTRNALAAYQPERYLLGVWQQLLAHRMFGVVADTAPRFGADTPNHRKIFRPVDETLLANLEEAARLAEGVPPSSPNRRGDGHGRTTRERRQDERRGRAFALLQEHPDWVLQQFADEIGCSRNALYGLTDFMSCYRACEGSKEDLPRGSKSRDGRVEARPV